MRTYVAGPVASGSRREASVGSKTKTVGLVIREMSLGESDRLVTVLTRDEGVVRAFARRAKNINDSKNAATGLMCYSRLDLYRGREKYIINGAVPIETFFGLRADIVNLSLGQYLCELAGELVPEGVESGEYLRLVLNALHFLSSQTRPPEQVKPIVELRMLSMSGYMPDLVGCAACGRYESPRMFLRVNRGELFCQDCYINQGSPAVGLSPGALTAMRHIVYADFDRVFSFNLAPGPLRELGDAAEAYMVSVLQKRPKTLDFYKSLLV